jgi:phosphatidylglycerol lysyltransferase
MADPVGAREACADLLWTIREMADAAQGRLLLYEISDETLGCAIELGLHVVKCGEEALVDLAGFSLEGSAMRALRQAVSRARRDGLTFEVVRAADVGALIPAFALVSDEWLAAKGQTEKGFSLGRFDPAYLAHFDCAVIRKAGQVVAFANLWATADKSELSIDLMRHSDEAPPGTMDFLFISLMLWGKAQQYERFSLGLAPFSGIEGKPLAPTWAKIARLLFEHGERFYGFKGLRAYKDKFDPRWESRYIAGPRGLAMIQGLLDLNALIGR